MADLLWSQLDVHRQTEYIKYLKIIGTLSGLFKELAGVNKNKPYLYYRNHELCFVKSFNVEGITRKDSAFDAIAEIEDKKIGIGLKTWIHSSDLTNQKVAEFNKKSSELRKLFDKQEFLKLAKRIAQLRNERISADKRLYETTEDVYHIVSRDDNVMHILEVTYDVIDLDSIKITKSTSSSLFFKDGTNNYLFNISKSTLFKQFDASKPQRIESIPITIYNDPFELLAKLWSFYKKREKEEYKEQLKEQIFLPLYNDKEYIVNQKSSFNSFNAKPKTKGSNKLRPEYEAYAPIPIYIHKLYPSFFGFDALNQEERSKNNFTLILPNKQKIIAKVTQDNGKALQTNPQNILGKWLLYSIFGLKPYQILTREIIDELEIDSIVITKISAKEFKVDVAEYLGYEKWKLQHKEKLQQLKKEKEISRLPTFRDSIIKQFEDNE